MSFSKKLGLFISGFLFRSSLFVGLTLLAAVIVVGNRDTVKNALIATDSYSRYTTSIIDTGKEQSKNDPRAIPLDDPRVAEIIKASLDKKSLQKISENAVDSSYDWLEGKSGSIEFSVDVSQNRQLLAEQTANYAVERIVNLPVCTEIPTETNIFQISCYPFNTDINSVRSEVYDSVMRDKSIFASSTLTAENLPKASDGRKIEDAYSKAPMYFTLFKASPWIFIAIAFSNMVWFMLLSRSKKKRLRAVATSILGTGVILAIAPLLYTYVLPSLGLSLPGTSSTSNQSISAISNDVMKYIYGEFNTSLINIAIQTVVVGSVLFLASMFLFKSPSVYKGLSKKTGLAISINDVKVSVGPKISASDVPIQTSEKRGRTKHKPSRLEKKFRRM